MKSSFRARTIERAANSPRTLFAARRSPGQRGYVLISAIALAVLYFGLMQLMLIDSSRALREAQQFRARIVASALAENGAELAAADMVKSPRGSASYEDDQGKMTGAITVSGNDFEINAKGDAAGVIPASATVRVQGRIIGTHIAVDYTFHSQ
ncbi:MAG TPA: hypothetical protein VL284_08160 [Thermoanaerobaculia bacterium]|nr:hypothetical protein [Thermoanaerobaculia bacterium]